MYRLYLFLEHDQYWLKVAADRHGGNLIPTTEAISGITLLLTIRRIRGDAVPWKYKWEKVDV